MKNDERTMTQLRLENRNQVERIKALQAEVKKHHDVMVEIRKERDDCRARLADLVRRISNPPKLTTVDAGKCVCGLALVCPSGLHTTRGQG